MFVLSWLPTLILFAYIDERCRRGCTRPLNVSFVALLIVNGIALSRCTKRAAEGVIQVRRSGVVGVVRLRGQQQDRRVFVAIIRNILAGLCVIRLEKREDIWKHGRFSNRRATGRE